MVLVFRPSGFALEGLGVVWGHGGSVWVQNLSDSDGHCGLSVVLSDSVLAASAASPPKLTSCSSEEKGVQVVASGCGVMRTSGRFREFARLGASSAQMQQQGSHDDATNGDEYHHHYHYSVRGDDILGHANADAFVVISTCLFPTIDVSTLFPFMVFISG